MGSDNMLLMHHHFYHRKCSSHQPLICVWNVPWHIFMDALLIFFTYFVFSCTLLISFVNLFSNCTIVLTHWGPVTHICISELTTIGPGNGLSPRQRQAIIWANAGILLIRPLGTNFNEILIEIHTFSFKKIHLKCRLRSGVHFVSASMCWVTWLWEDNTYIPSPK